MELPSRKESIVKTVKKEMIRKQRVSENPTNSIGYHQQTQEKGRV